jgi:SAM-dependent methyltransferase
MDFAELKRVADLVGERRGWSFDRMRAASDPAPWEYEDVVRRYLQPSRQVLDIGTGGGERFLALAPFFGTGLGVDVSPAMSEVAQENTPPDLVGKVSFAIMPAEELRVPDHAFDIVLNRHSVVHVDEIVRVLRPGGFFITQGVGSRNTQNICAVFGCNPGGEYVSDVGHKWGTASESRAAFEERGCAFVAQAEYDIRYWFLDVESLLFWLKAIPIPQDFEIERQWQQVDHILTEYQNPVGIETNEHRELLIVRKLLGGQEQTAQCRFIVAKA